MSASIEKRIERIGGRLRSLREASFFSQEELAKRAGVDRKTVNRIENGHFSPSVYTLLALCDALKVDAREIISA